jgi:predicted nucleic acid-binding protein
MADRSADKSRKVLIDMQIIYEVLEKKPPHDVISSELVGKVLSRQIQGVLPGYAIMAIYQKLRNESATQQAEDVIDWFLANFEIATINKEIIVTARSSEVESFEAAMMVYTAIFNNCNTIITRSPADYPDNMVEVLTPEELLYQLSADKS